MVSTMRKEINRVQLNILVRRRTRDRLRKLAEKLTTEKVKVTQTSLIERLINTAYVREFDLKGVSQRESKPKTRRKSG